MLSYKAKINTAFFTVQFTHYHSASNEGTFFSVASSFQGKVANPCSNKSTGHQKILFTIVHLMIVVFVLPGKKTLKHLKQ